VLDSESVENGPDKPGGKSLLQAQFNFIVGLAYSERFRPVIPTEAGHLFRAKAASHSDLKPATFWPGSEWVAGMRRNDSSF